jgi:hypothetical protein
MENIGLFTATTLDLAIKLLIYAFKNSCFKSGYRIHCKSCRMTHSKPLAELIAKNVWRSAGLCFFISKKVKI